MKKFTRRLSALVVFPALLLGCGSSGGGGTGGGGGTEDDGGLAGSGGDPSGGSAGTSGSAGSGGVSGNGGVSGGGNGGASGSAGDAGNGGTAGASGGDAGTGGSAGIGGNAGIGGSAGSAGAAQGGSAGSINPDPSWSGRPPAAPLFVRNPYLSTWLPADGPNGTWPTFWTGTTKAMSGIARVDGIPYVVLGAPAAGGAHAVLLQSRKLTATNTEYVLQTGPVQFTFDFLSPVEPGDLKRQSAPIAYLRTSAHATDGGTHAASIYFDISGEWAHGDSNQMVDWARQTVPHSGGDLIIQSFTPHSPQNLVEINQYPAWGTAFLAAPAAATTTYAIGSDATVRAMGANQGTLDGSLDADMPRAINNRWPVLGFNFDLGQVSTATEPVTLVIGNERDPAVSYRTVGVPPLWKAFWPTWQDMVADAYDDVSDAVTRNAALDLRIATDARAAGGDNYSALCTLALRQTLGGTELVGTADKPWLMLKEISSDGNVSTVDVAYPASPALLYLDPLLVKLMLDPLLEYAESGFWTKQFAEHDLGSSYPNASCHDDGNEEDMPIEESADMLIMMAAYAKRAKPEDAKAYSVAHYEIAKQWAQYLVPHTLDPQNQNQTDDFTGFINHSANLALKGIVGVGAMSILSGFAEKTADHDSFLGEAQSLIESWAAKAQDGSGQHLLLEYDVPGSWSLKYNLLYDRILGLNLVSSAIVSEEAAWYTSQEQGFGVDLDPRNAYTKSDWELWTAGAIEDKALRQFFIDSVYDYATTSTARVPFSDWYDTANGHNHGFQARPVQGGMFSLLARYAPPIASP